jgi:hypothetical protein
MMMMVVVSNNSPSRNGTTRTALLLRLLLLITAVLGQEDVLIGSTTTGGAGGVVAVVVAQEPPAPALSPQHHTDQHSSSSADSIDCYGANTEVAHLQLYYKVSQETTPLSPLSSGARWTLRCNDDPDLVWDGATTDDTTMSSSPSWWFENLCVNVTADTCQFTITAPAGDSSTFYALVVGATTIAVSSKEKEDAIDETVCFGLLCDQPPLERDDDDDAGLDDDHTSTTKNEDEEEEEEGETTTGREGADGPVRGGADVAAKAADPNVIQNQHVQLIRQTGFIIWITSMAVTFAMVLLVWYCAVRIRHYHQQANAAAAADEVEEAFGRKDDDTVREESGCERDDEEEASRSRR